MTHLGIVLISSLTVAGLLYALAKLEGWL